MANLLKIFTTKPTSKY